MTRIWATLVSGLSLLIIATSCESLREEVAQRLNRVKEEGKKEHVLEISVPPGIQLGLRHELDTARNLWLDWHLPEGDTGTYAAIHEKLREELTKGFDKFLVRLDTAIGRDSSMITWDPSNYWIIPSSIYDSSDMVSYCYEVYSNISGFEHPTRTYHCSTWRKSDGQRLKLTHLLSLKDNKHKDTLITILNSRLDSLDGWVSSLDSVEFGLVPGGFLFQVDPVVTGHGEISSRKVLLKGSALGNLLKREEE